MDWEVKQDTVVEFEYDGFIPSGGFRNFSDFTEHPIHVTVVDTEGNVRSRSIMNCGKLRHTISPRLTGIGRQSIQCRFLPIVNYSLPDQRIPRSCCGM